MTTSQTFDKTLDGPRLESLLHRVRDLMLSGGWFTLSELVEKVGGSEAGVSARIRELRRVYNYDMEKRRRGEPSRGLWEYRLSYESDQSGQLRLPGAA